MELIELLEVTTFDHEVQDTIKTVYEVYKGDWVSLYNGGSYPSWYTVEWWQENCPDSAPTARRPFMVRNEVSIVGCWVTLIDFYRYLSLYMKALNIIQVCA